MRAAACMHNAAGALASNLWPSAAASANPRTPVTIQVQVQVLFPSEVALKLPATCFLWRIDDNATAPAACSCYLASDGSPSYPTPKQLQELANASEMVD